MMEFQKTIFGGKLMLRFNVQSVCSPLLMERKIGKKCYFVNNLGKPIFPSRELDFAPISHEGKFEKGFIW